MPPGFCMRPAATSKGDLSSQCSLLILLPSRQLDQRAGHGKVAEQCHARSHAEIRRTRARLINMWGANPAPACLPAGHAEQDHIEEGGARPPPEPQDQQAVQDRVGGRARAERAEPRLPPRAGSAGPVQHFPATGAAALAMQTAEEIIDERRRLWLWYGHEDIRLIDI